MFALFVGLCCVGRCFFVFCIVHFTLLDVVCMFGYVRATFRFRRWSLRRRRLPARTTFEFQFPFAAHVVRIEFVRNLFHRFVFFLYILFLCEKQIFNFLICFCMLAELEVVQMAYSLVGWTSAHSTHCRRTNWTPIKLRWVLFCVGGFLNWLRFFYVESFLFYFVLWCFSQRRATIIFLNYWLFLLFLAD